MAPLESRSKVRHRSGALHRQVVVSFLLESDDLRGPPAQILWPASSLPTTPSALRRSAHAGLSTASQPVETVTVSATGSSANKFFA